MSYNSKEQEMLNLLEDMVNMDSHSYDKEGVDNLGNYLSNLYQSLGFVPTVHENDELGNNIMLQHKDAVSPEIIILAHMDTVFEKGTVSKRPFMIKDNIAYGPGVIDMKASHVMLYYAVKYLVEQDIDVYKNVQILFNSDEEIRSISSEKLIKEYSKDKNYALVLEPARANGSIVSSRRGAANYKIDVSGIAAHSGINPDKGASAIKELAHKIFKIEDLSEAEDGLHVNVVQMEGGEAANIISPNAHAVVDVRISSLDQGHHVDKEINTIAHETYVEGTETTITGGISRPPMEYTEETEELVHMIKEQADLLDIDLNDTHTGGGSDASFPAALGITTIDGLGPVGGNQHSEDEYLIVNTLFERTDLFIEILKNLKVEE